MIHASVYHRTDRGDIFLGEAQILRLPAAGQIFDFGKRWRALSVWIRKGNRASIVVKPYQD